MIKHLFVLWIKGVLRYLMLGWFRFVYWQKKWISFSITKKLSVYKDWKLWHFLSLVLWLTWKSEKHLLKLTWERDCGRWFGEYARSAWGAGIDWRVAERRSGVGVQDWGLTHHPAGCPARPEVAWPPQQWKYSRSSRLYFRSHGRLQRPEAGLPKDVTKQKILSL